MTDYSIDSLDSLQFVYDRKAPAAISVCVLVAFIVVCSVILYASTNMKTESVELTGYVDAYDAVYISTMLSGVIESEPPREGSEVFEGDIVLKIRNRDLESQLEACNEYITYYSGEKENYSLIVSSMERYNINYGPDAVESNKNPFPEDNLLFHFMYDSTLKELKQIDENHQKLVKAKQDARKIAEETAKEAGETFNYSKWSAEYDEDHEIEKPLTEQRKQMVAQAIYDAKKSIQGIEPALMQYTKSAEILDSQINSGTLLSPISGTIHYASTLYKGQYVTEGTNLAVISENDGDSKMILSLLPAEYRAFVHEDMETSMTVAGYPENIYGRLSGRIQSINQITTVTEQGSFYAIRIVLDEHGDEIVALPGMIVICSIPYSEKSWLDWAVSQFEV